MKLSMVYILNAGAFILGLVFRDIAGKVFDGLGVYFVGLSIIGGLIIVNLTK